MIENISPQVAQENIKPLFTQIKDENINVRIEILKAIGKYMIHCGDMPEMYELIFEATSDPKWRVREQSIFTMMSYLLNVKQNNEQDSKKYQEKFLESILKFFKDPVS